MHLSSLLACRGWHYVKPPCLPSRDEFSAINHCVRGEMTFVGCKGRDDVLVDGTAYGPLFPMSFTRAVGGGDLACLEKDWEFEFICFIHARVMLVGSHNVVTPF